MSCVFPSFFLFYQIIGLKESRFIYSKNWVILLIDTYLIKLKEETWQPWQLHPGNLLARSTSMRRTRLSVNHLIYKSPHMTRVGSRTPPRWHPYSLWCFQYTCNSCQFMPTTLCHGSLRTKRHSLQSLQSFKRNNHPASLISINYNYQMFQSEQKWASLHFILQFF